jgi:hypothetical protein
VPEIIDVISSWRLIHIYCFVVQSGKGKVAAKTTKDTKKVAAAPVANPLFQSKPKSFRIGGDVRVRPFSFGCDFRALYLILWLLRALDVISPVSSDGPTMCASRDKRRLVKLNRVLNELN